MCGLAFAFDRVRPPQAAFCTQVRHVGRSRPPFVLAFAWLVFNLFVVFGHVVRLMCFRFSL